MERMYSKGEVVDLLWQYSHYYGNQLVFLSEIEENGNASLLYLFNILENILKSSVSDYESTFQNVVKISHKNNLINQKEHDFLNNKVIGVRKIRNLLAHANLAKYNLKFVNDPSLYPIVENDACQKLYDLISDIIFNIILKVVSHNFTIEVNPNVDHLIHALNYKIVEISPEEILTDKGIDFNRLPDWDTLSESDKYRHAENTQNVKVLTHILGCLKKE